MGVGRGEVERWRWGGGRDAPAVRSRAIANAMAPAAFTSKWQELPPAERRLTGVRALELADPAEEAQAIAIALREALESPGRTAALVTPGPQPRPPRLRASQALGHRGGRQRRAAAVADAARHLAARARRRAAAERFAPVPLLPAQASAGHEGRGRLEWLEGVRALDLALRGPRPPAGLTASATISPTGAAATASAQARGAWWREARPLLRPLERAFAAERPSLAGCWRRSARRLPRC
jgi:ATP-dependent helicase/nuclease subunit B